MLEAADALLRDEAAQKSMGTAGIDSPRATGGDTKTLEMIERYL
ncbi:MAG: hypothetical protein M5R42_12585 [Rhodocyclaceae bacterium]|nr:hypothetical protein [Rhodocyclaceae bacterium]